MSIKNILTQFINLASRLFQTFYFSIIRAREFFFTKKYDIIKVNGNLYLYLSLLLYLIFFTSVLYSNELSYVLKTADRFTVSVNIIELIFLTIPLYLYCIVLSKVQVFAFKYLEKERLYYVSLITFSNVLFWESGIYLLRTLLNRILSILEQDYKIVISIKSVHKVFYFISEFGLWVIPGYIFFIILKEYKGRVKYSLWLFFPITAYATYIVFSSYNFEYKLLKDPLKANSKRVEFYDKENLATDVWNLSYFMVAPDTAELSSEFFIKNNTEIDYYAAPVFSFTVTEEEQNNHKGDSALKKLIDFFNDYPFDEVYINGALCTDYFILKPKELVSVRIARKIPYDLPHAVLLQEVTNPAIETIPYKFKFNHSLDPIDDNLDSTFVSTPTIQIMNFTEDRRTINMYFDAILTYRKADSSLGFKRTRNTVTSSKAVRTKYR